MRLNLYRPSLALLATLSIGSPAAAQSVLDRTPNLSGGWVGDPGTVYFSFLHRFDVISDVDKVVNSPTFLLGYPFASLVLTGVQYASNVNTTEGGLDFNEWELFLRFAPLKPGANLPFELALTAAYSESASSLDGELSLGVPIGPATLMGALRGFTDGYGSGDGRLAVGGGIRLRASDNVALAADVVSLTSGREGEEIGWGAALQLAIPFTPHTLSLQAANTNTSTLQGSSRRAGGSGGTRWGFEFTIPFTLSRYFGGGVSASDRTVSADSVVVSITDFEFGVDRLTVNPGTTVTWINEGGVPHTSTSDDGLWSSPLLAPGESYARVFRDPGEFPYHCQPHPFMTGTVVVREGG